MKKKKHVVFTWMWLASSQHIWSCDLKPTQLNGLLLLFELNVCTEFIRLSILAYKNCLAEFEKLLFMRPKNSNAQPKGCRLFNFSIFRRFKKDARNIIMLILIFFFSFALSKQCDAKRILCCRWTADSYMESSPQFKYCTHRTETGCTTDRSNEFTTNLHLLQNWINNCTASTSQQTKHVSERWSQRRPKIRGWHAKYMTMTVRTCLNKILISISAITWIFS